MCVADVYKCRAKQIISHPFKPSANTRISSIFAPKLNKQTAILTDSADTQRHTYIYTFFHTCTDIYNDTRHRHIQYKKYIYQWVACKLLSTHKHLFTYIILLFFLQIYHFLFLHTTKYLSIDGRKSDDDVFEFTNIYINNSPNDTIYKTILLLLLKMIRQPDFFFGIRRSKLLTNIRFVTKHNVLLNVQSRQAIFMERTIDFFNTMLRDNNGSLTFEACSGCPIFVMKSLIRQWNKKSYI